MIWEELFPWSHQKKIITNTKSPQALNGSTLIKSSLFINIYGDSALSIIDKDYYCSIDYCSFINCSSKDANLNKGCTHFTLLNYGSVSITRTIGDSCSSINEGNFAYIKVADKGNIFVMMTSIDKCSPDLSKERYHSILMISGTQIARNINNTRCFANRHAGFSNYHSRSAQVDFCNVVDNTANMTCIHCFTEYCDVRRVNYIRNHQNYIYERIPGIVGLFNYDKVPNRVVLSDCVFNGNSGGSTISVFNGDITLIGCCLQTESFAGSYSINGTIFKIDSASRLPVTMTLFARHGKHADIPYGRRSTKMFMKRKPIISVSLMSMMLMVMMKEGNKFVII